MSFTLEFWPFLDGHMMPISNHILLLWIKLVLSSQLLPTLDIYSWTEEHVVRISVFLLTAISIVIQSRLLLKLLNHDFLPLVFLDAANIWRRFVHYFLNSSDHLKCF